MNLNLVLQGPDTLTADVVAKEVERRHTKCTLAEVDGETVSI